MNSIADQLANSPIERWVKNVELLDLGDGSPREYTLGELREEADRIKLSKRDKPSYQWQNDEHERWWRVWFKESNLTLQIDLHSSNGNYQRNMHEIDLERCTTAATFIEWLYHSTLRKQWACPEMLWAKLRRI